jgi:enoyl-CoA hydratase/carnithine racemase
MDGQALEPWMLLSDWRADRRPWLSVDLASWPAETPIEPRPPAALIGVGDPAHPQAGQLDLIVEPGFSLEQLAARIEQAPHATSTVLQLLRATEGLALEHALTAESFAFAMLQGGEEHASWLATRPREEPAAAGRVRVERRGARLEVVLDRPWALNAIDRGMRDALFEACTLAALDDEIREVRLRGVGRCFSMGADLAEFGTTRDPAEAHAIRERTLPARPMMRRAHIYDVHVQGACVGSGLELAAFAGRLTASPGAWFQLPETAMGILPGFGGCTSLPRRIGRQRAALAMLSGKRIGVETALRWGLVDAVMDDPAADEGGADEVGG